MQLKLKKVQISFCQNLFVAGAMNAGDTPRFSSTFLIPKSDAATLEKVRLAIEETARLKWHEKAAATLQSLNAAGRVCFKDGAIKSQYEGFADSYYISASSRVKPKVFDYDNSELDAMQGRIYAGCYVDAVLDLWAEDDQFGKRINAALQGVRFAAEGTAFGSGSLGITAADFDDAATAAAS